MSNAIRSVYVTELVVVYENIRNDDALKEALRP